MIQFQCPTCHASYTVPDARAGQRTTCPRCQTRLTVPTATAPKPPVRVVRRRLLAVAGGAGVLILGVFTLYQLRPNPTADRVQRELRDTLPPGYSDFKVESYNRDTGELRLVVTYREFGDIVGVKYEVVRFHGPEALRGGGGWLVQVTGRRQQLDAPFERWLMIVATFDRAGRMTWKGEASAAGPNEGPVVEERARGIARAVYAAF